MANGDAGGVIGGIFLIGVVIVAVLAAVTIILATGSLIGIAVGFANYCKAFQANVSLERAGV